ncbi:MAG: Fic family protein [Lachnospiraceae bacterium]|nr:Fic family protein [Lachnospiraceae bacterium]
MLSMHRFLFRDIFDHAGEYRRYNIAKKEPVLGGRSVVYADFRSIRDTLAYDFREEKDYEYYDMSHEKMVRHISKFVSDIWQVHPFMEGNTRTTVLFTERYLRSLGFDVDNEMFARHARYFRNALVRANYADFQRGIYADHSYLEQFFDNLIYHADHRLQSRDLILQKLVE